MAQDGKETFTAQTRAGPDRATIFAFATIVLIGGLNFVAVKFSNRELDPFFGAGTRFLAASLVFFCIMLLQRVGFPTGKALIGALIYGLLGFAAFYALAYWALKGLPAGIVAVVAGSVPLLTVFLAAVHGIEKFRMRGLLGASISVLGIAVLILTKEGGALPIIPLLAVLGAALCAAESGVLLKRFPPSHPVATNAVATGSGSLVLLLLSVVAKENWIVPKSGATLLSFGYLVAIGSVAMFGLYLFTLKGWTASGVSYMFVLMPIVAAIAAAILAKEAITLSTVAGGLIVLAGVYVGALSGTHRKERHAPAPEGCTPAEEKTLAAATTDTRRG